MSSKLISAVTAACTLALTLAGAGSALAQDASLDPRFGEIDLEAGFTPDPYSQQVRAGGRTDASNLGGSCVGMISEEPTFRVNYDAGRDPIYFYVYSDSDTTLVINQPNGAWNCNDDGDGSGGINPGLRFRSPASGAYDIWVGNLSGGPANARLVITEIPPQTQQRQTQQHQGPSRRGQGPNRGPNRGRGHY